MTRHRSKELSTLDLGVGWSREELEEPIGAYDGPIRSATKLDAPLIARASRLRAVGRAGVGVDNVDVDTTKRGIIVANAPQSNVITRGRAHYGAAAGAGAQRAAGARLANRGSVVPLKFSGVELYEKTLGSSVSGRSANSWPSARGRSECT